MSESEPEVKSDLELKHDIVRARIGIYESALRGEVNIVHTDVYTDTGRWSSSHEVSQDPGISLEETIEDSRESIDGFGGIGYYTSIAFLGENALTMAIESLRHQEASLLLERISAGEITLEEGSDTETRLFDSIIQANEGRTAPRPESFRDIQ